ncbi:hypothetical protein VNO77_44484 [Canavalia gladiata]|uniref:Uncharacterized protein n=1 Tax=Canavalia gladiata TaxID=3824 RepID=A0AAN9JWT1_CANGL
MYLPSSGSAQCDTSFSGNSNIYTANLDWVWWSTAVDYEFVFHVRAFLGSPIWALNLTGHDSSVFMVVEKNCQSVG